MTMKSLVMAIAITATAAPVLAQGPLPFRASTSSSEYNAGFTFPIARQILNGEGHATHLGRFRIDAEWDVNVLTLDAVGTFTLTSASGDTVSGTASGAAVVVDGIAYISETCVITSGTGRFAKATGTFVGARVLDTAAGTSEAAYSGRIDLH
jgi:hypothetical protein